MANAHPSASLANLKASIEVYLKAQLGGVTGIPTDVEEAYWDFGQRQDWQESNYRVRVTLITDKGRPYGRVSNTQAGYLVPVFIFLDLFANRVKYENDLAIVQKTLFKLLSAFPINGQIEVLNYMNHTGAANGASLGHLQMVSVETPRVPDEENLLRGQIVAELQWTTVGDNL